MRTLASLSLLLVAVAGAASCSLLQGPDTVLAYSSTVHLNVPSAGWVTMSAIVTNVGERGVNVGADQCSIGYRLTTSDPAVRFELDPRVGICGMPVGNGGYILPGESTEVRSVPFALSAMAPSGSYFLTILVNHSEGYREINAGQLIIPATS